MQDIYSTVHIQIYAKPDVWFKCVYFSHRKHIKIIKNNERIRFQMSDIGAFKLLPRSSDMMWYRRYTMFQCRLKQHYLSHHIVNSCHCEEYKATNKNTHRADCWPLTSIYNRLNKWVSPTLTLHGSIVSLYFAEVWIVYCQAMGRLIWYCMKLAHMDVSSITFN